MLSIKELVVDVVIVQDEESEDENVAEMPSSSARRSVRKNRYDMADAPSPRSGRLADRIRLIKDRCISDLGERAFREAYEFLREAQQQDGQ